MQLGIKGTKGHLALEAFTVYLSKHASRFLLDTFLGTVSPQILCLKRLDLQNQFKIELLDCLVRVI